MAVLNQQCFKLYPLGLVTRSIVPRALLILCLFLSFCSATDAAPVRASEYELKAAYLHRFALFTDWPANTFTNAAQPLVIGILGQDPFGSLLEKTISTEKVRGRSLEFRRSRTEIPPGCHILYISPSEVDRLPSIHDHLKGSKTLTVSDMDEFCRRGGAIEFIRSGTKLNLGFNLVAIRREGLSVNPGLLSVASFVLR